MRKGWGQPPRTRILTAKENNYRKSRHDKGLRDPVLSEFVHRRTVFAVTSSFLLKGVRQLLRMVSGEEPGKRAMHSIH